MSKEFWAGLSLTIIGLAGAGILLSMQIGNIITQNNAQGWLILFTILLLAGLIILILSLLARKGNQSKIQVINNISANNAKIIELESDPKDSCPVINGRIVVNVEPNYLTGMFKGYTILQAKKLAENYMGKWMKLAGPINDVTQLGDTYIVYLENHLYQSGATVSMRFDKSWKDRLSVLKIGDNIVVLGQIKEIDRTVVLLDKCELIDS